MRLSLHAFAASLLLSSISAYADTAYTIENQAGTASYGTVTINTTTGMVSGVSATQTIGGVPVTFSGPPSSQAYNTALNEYQATFTAAGNQLQLDLPETSLVSYAPANGSSCAVLAFTCDYEINEYQGLAAGMASPVNSFEGNLLATTATSVTPEPSSLALLGSGLLGVVGVARRRYKQGV